MTIVIDREKLNFIIYFINIFFTILFDNTQIKRFKLQFFLKF